MFGQNNINEFPYNYYSEFQGYFPPPETSTTKHQTFPSIPGEHDSLSALRWELGYTSSGCSSYGGSPTSITSYGTYSPTFYKNLEVYSPMNSSPRSLLYFELEETSSVRKAGDLQVGVNLGQHSIIESMKRASPYSPEEKKERIERYRNKRNLRNFNKKIKYECRKTLADSRPRIRGRFARNHDEIEKTPQSQWVEQDDDDNWINIFLDRSSHLSNTTI